MALTSFRRALLLVVASLLSVTAAHAGPIELSTTASARASYKVPGSPQVDNWNGQSGTGSASAWSGTPLLSYDDSFHWGGSAAGGGSANAAYGTLGAYAVAGYQVTPLTQSSIWYDANGVPHTFSETTPIFPSAMGYGLASFSDSVTVVSSTLAPHTRVTVNATLSVSGAGNGSLRAGLNKAGVLNQDRVPGYGLFLDNNSGGVINSFLYFFVGDTIPLYGWLETMALVPTSGCTNWYGTAVTCGSESMVENASSTGHFYLDVPAGSDFSLVFESGHGYSTPSGPAAVPEPATLVLVATGVAATLGRSRRRSR